MSDEQTVDMMAGLNAVVAILEAIRVDVRAIGPVDRVRLASLQWAMDRLAEDLHDANVELRNARLEVASARSEADRANEQHAVAVRKYDAEVERRLALEKQVAELTARAKKPWLEWQPPAHVDKLYKRIPGDGIMVHNLIGGDRDLQKLYEAGWRYLPITPENELTKKLGELPTEPAPEWHRWNRGTKLFHPRHPDVRRGLHDATLEDMERMYNDGWRELVEPAEPYQWQVGDEIRTNCYISPIEELCDGKFRLEGTVCFVSQVDAHRWGWKLHRKASDLPRHDDLPDIPAFTPQQVADFAAVTEPIDDSVGTDGEGQS